MLLTLIDRMLYL